MALDRNGMANRTEGGAGRMTGRIRNLRGGDLLTVLRRATHADLKLIVEALDRSWDVRIKADPRYQRADHNLTIIPEVIGDYITRAGGNAVRNWWRGGGPDYAEVLRDVCEVMDVEVPPGMAVLAMEEKLLHDVMERIWEAMTPQEREEVVRAAEGQLQATGRRFAQTPGGKMWLLPFSALAAQIGLKMAGFIVYQVAVQVANAAARQVLKSGLTLAANAALARGIAVVIGPVGWAVTAVWTAVDALGPSYRGLAPAVFHVAALRQKFLWEDDDVEAAA